MIEITDTIPTRQIGFDKAVYIESWGHFRCQNCGANISVQEAVSEQCRVTETPAADVYCISCRTMGNVQRVATTTKSGVLKEEPELDEEVDFDIHIGPNPSDCTIKYKGELLTGITNLTLCADANMYTLQMRTIGGHTILQSPILDWKLRAKHEEEKRPEPIKEPSLL